MQSPLNFSFEWLFQQNQASHEFPKQKAMNSSYIESSVKLAKITLSVLVSAFVLMKRITDLTRITPK